MNVADALESCPFHDGDLIIKQVRHYYATFLQLRSLLIVYFANHPFANYCHIGSMCASMKVPITMVGHCCKSPCEPLSLLCKNVLFGTLCSNTCTALVVIGLNFHLDFANDSLYLSVSLSGLRHTLRLPNISILSF